MNEDKHGDVIEGMKNAFLLEAMAISFVLASALATIAFARMLSCG